MDRPENLRYEKHSEDRPQKRSKQDTNYAQHNPTPPAEANPNHNPSKNPMSILHAETVDREKLLKNINNLSKLEKIRLSRLSYLKHINRYNVRNA